jgi:hypothetical protein
MHILPVLESSAVSLAVPADAVIPGLHVIEGGQTSTGSIVRWLNSSLVGEEGWPGYEALNAAAADIPPGCEGLLCCDHFQVSRICFGDFLCGRSKHLPWQQNCTHAVPLASNRDTALVTITTVSNPDSRA